MSNLYDIKNFTDDQLYSILDMDHPTDRELEAKIIHLIRKYENIQNEDGNRLSHFFKQVYDHFFDNSEENIVVEGFDATTDPILQTNPNTTSIQTEQIGYEASGITAVQPFDYSKDKLQLNPLLKQTIKRVISIDSQYRNISTSPVTTNFSFDLSEPLRDVLSLKLYSIQIPYTWYIINKNYGANFFYIKTNNPKIADGKHDIKISIPIGNYGANDLITAINTSFQKEINTYPINDIQFSGNSIVSYNSFNSKTTFNLDFKNVYNEAYYKIDFSYVMPSAPPTQYNLRTTNIASYLGFNDISYSFNTIQSNQTYISTNVIQSQINQNIRYAIDNSNNYFKIVQYQGPTPYIETNTLNTYTIQLGLINGFYNISTIITAVNNAIQENGNFTIDSKIVRQDIVDLSVANTGNSFYKLTMVLDRYKVPYIPNSKLCIIFPLENILPNSINNLSTLWTISTNSSCFFFDNLLYDTCEILSEIPTIQSTFTLDTSANMQIRLICNTENYNNGENDFYLPIQPSPNKSLYTLYEYKDRINAAFFTANTTYHSSFLNTAPFSVDNQIFDIKINIIKSFNETNCEIYINPNFNSLLYTYFGYTNNYQQDLSNSNIVTFNFTPQTSGYIVDNFSSYYLFTIRTNGTDGNTMTDISVNLQPTSATYATYVNFVTDIQRSIQNTPVQMQIGGNTTTLYPLFNSTFMTNTIGSNTSLTINYSLNLTEQNYSIFFDGSINNTSNTYWSLFDLSASYNLFTKMNGTFAEISGNIIGGQILLLQPGYNSFSIYTITNPLFPYIPKNTITIDLSPNTPYTINDVYTAINNKLTANPLTYGSSISSYINPVNNESYSKFRICINDIYTASDYYLEFYDPISFSTCLPTSSSIQNTTWDSTIGWILGFRDYTQYYLTQANQTIVTIGTNIIKYYLTSFNGEYTIQSTQVSNTTYSNYTISLTGDTTLSTNLYNYFLISLDDYIQNRINDGLVTITRNDTSITIPSYSYSTTKVCDPATNTLVSTSLPQSNSDNVTQKQIYALNQSLQSTTNQTKQYSSGPFVKDLFGLIPIKPGTNGTYYIEFGGTLQNQERVYFGPVNIRKMTIQLLNDRGDIVDLNGSNWSFSFICEQLYRDNSS